MSTPFEVRMNEKHQQVRRLRADMDRGSAEFLVSAAAFVAGWYREVARRTVEREHSVTESLTNEQLADLKRDVEGLASAARSSLDEFASGAKLWWHLADPLPKAESLGMDDPWRYEFYGNRPPDRLDKAIRLVLGKLAALLEPLGYLKGPGSGSPSDPGWREYDAGGHRKLPRGRYSYPYAIDWPADLREAIERYAALKKKVVSILSEIDEATENEKRAQARARWDA